MTKYSLFIGRWQNWHKGHEWLINQQLEKGKSVWVAIRDVEIDENNPNSAQTILENLNKETFFIQNKEKILISIIPDIDSVNYGRGVGYDVIYHEPPNDISNISGTKIRKGIIDNEGNSKETLG
jgi:phosphopantetheine adenylyltransferase